MKTKWKITLSAIVVIILIAIGFSAYYINDYNHADSNAINKALNNNDNVKITNISNGLFIDGPGDENALIFYPGAKVEYTSYLPMLEKLSAKGTDCFLVEMPFNIAFLGTDKADEIITNYNYTHWYLSGHSLGGVAASSYTSKHLDKVDGLILFAAYTTENLKNSNLKVLSIYGSNDKVLNKKTYDEDKVYLPSTLTEFIIKGGNHGQFGNYGFQEGDGKATISSENQQKQAVDKIISFIDS